MTRVSSEKLTAQRVHKEHSDYIAVKEKGLTLIELVVALAVAITLTTLISTGWTPTIERLSATAVKSKINRTFNQARAQAVFNNRIVTLCPLDLQNKCSSDWRLPVAIFEDQDNLQKVSDREQVIQFFQIADRGAVIPSKASGHSWRRYFQFNPDGTVRGTMGNLTWCPDSATDTYAIHVRVNLGGRLVWSLDNDQDGVVEDAGGQPVNCQTLLEEYL